MALAPYSRVAGPRTTSTWVAAAGLMVTPWSPDWLERSPVRWLFCRIRTRSPSWPRMMGREGPGPSDRSDTPGSLRSSPPSDPSSLMPSS